MSDLISRQAAIRIAEQGQIQGFEWQFKKLCELPSAEPERKKGKWVPVHPLQSDDCGAYMCSKCKTGMWEIRPSVYHFCPNCGADMRGEQDERTEYI